MFSYQIHTLKITKLKSFSNSISTYNCVLTLWWIFNTWMNILNQTLLKKLDQSISTNILDILNFVTFNLESWEIQTIVTLFKWLTKRCSHFFSSLNELNFAGYMIWVLMLIFFWFEFVFKKIWTYFPTVGKIWIKIRILNILKRKRTWIAMKYWEKSTNNILTTLLQRLFVSRTHKNQQES